MVEGLVSDRGFQEQVVLETVREVGYAQEISVEEEGQIVVIWRESEHAFIENILIYLVIYIVEAAKL